MKAAYLHWKGKLKAKLKGSAHVLLGEGRGKNLDMFLLKKGNFIMINEFRYGRPSPLSLSLYSTFNNLLTLWLNLILFGSIYFFFISIHTFNTVKYFTIAICIYLTGIDNWSSKYYCLQPFLDLEQLHADWSQMIPQNVLDSSTLDFQFWNFSLS